MIFQATLTIRTSKTKSGVIYTLWITFSRDLTAALGWTYGQRVTCTWYSNALQFVLTESKQCKGAPPKLGRYNNRPGMLWLRYFISPTQRKQFLKTYSNSFSTKIQYVARGMFALNSKLILSGKGTPVKRRSKS